MRKIAKIVIYDQVRVNGGSNYEYPGQRWVLKLVKYKIMEIWKKMKEKWKSARKVKSNGNLELKIRERKLMFATNLHFLLF